MRKIYLLLIGMALALVLAGSPVWSQNVLDADLLRLVESSTPDFLTIESIINEGADIDAADENGETALMKAARTNGDIAVAEILLGWGADVNAADAKGETALMKAAQYNSNPRMTELIGRLGSNVDQVDNTGETALMKACKYSQSEEVVIMILLTGADPKISANRKMAVDFAKNNSVLKGTETLDILKEMSK